MTMTSMTNGFKHRVGNKLLISVAEFFPRARHQNRHIVELRNCFDNEAIGKKAPPKSVSYFRHDA